MRAPALALSVLLLPAAANARFTAPRSFDLGPIASRYQDVHGEWHIRAAGPFFETATSTQGMEFVAVRPFYSEVADPPRDRTARDYAWPVATSRSLNEESNWRCLIFFGFNHDTEVARPRYRLWLFPFYFQGRDAKGVNYRAVFPLGGRLHEFLGRDEINFVLFPIRSTSKLRDLETSNWLWPVYSETKGEGIYRHRVFPFYGVSRLAGQYEKKFVLWPIWNQVRYDYSNSAGRGYILFPLFGHMKLTDQETWWAIPPFFRFTRGDKMDMTYCPWPFYQHVESHAKEEMRWPLIQKVRENDYERLYLWPLWGYKHVGNLDRTFWLWPFIWQQEVARADVDQYRFQVVPFFISQREENHEGLVTVRYNKFWPLYSYRREADHSRFRMLELWPFAETGGIERNWAPFWTLYSRVQIGQDYDHELLWGLYRNQKRGDESRYWSVFPLVDWRRDDESAHLRRWSLLKGLIGYERDDSRSFIRLLYFLKLGNRAEKKP